MTNTGATPAGWYHAPGDPDSTQRYWDATQWIGEPQAVRQAPGAEQSPQTQQDSDATVAYTPPPAATDPAAGQPPTYGAAPGAGQPPAYGAPPAAGQQPPAFGGIPVGQPPAYGSPPPGAGAPPGYTAFGGPGATTTGDLAEPVQRIVGRLVDGLIWIALNLVVGLIFGIGAIASGSDVSFISSFLAGVISLVLILVYEIVLTTKTGNTLGKKIFKIKIVNMDGSAVDEKTMLMRMVPYIALAVLGFVLPVVGGVLSGLGVLVIGVISIIFLFTDTMRQAIWDKVGKTKVVAGG